MSIIVHSDLQTHNGNNPLIDNFLPCLDVGGEYVRKNIIENQPGVPLTADFQVLDVETCEPVSDVYLEIWSEFTINRTNIQGQPELNDLLRLQLDGCLLRHAV